LIVTLFSTTKIGIHDLLFGSNAYLFVPLMFDFTSSQQFWVLLISIIIFGLQTECENAKQTYSKCYFYYHCFRYL